MHRTRIQWLSAALFFSGLFALTVWAQDAAPAAEPVARASKTVGELWKQGGWCMYPILLLSALSMGLGIYAGVFNRTSKTVQPELLPVLENAVGKLDFQSAASACAGSPGTMANIFGAGLRRLSEDHLDPDTVEKAMEEAAVEEHAAGMRPVNLISVAASLAPMFGLLGTVDGMIKAFQKIGLGGMGDPELLADDIGQAMVTTWFGLSVGIPAMLLYFVMKSQYQGRMARVGRVLGDLTHHLALTLKRARRGAAQG
jgi:biopolymer transport protein ExbB